MKKGLIALAFGTGCFLFGAVASWAVVARGQSGAGTIESGRIGSAGAGPIAGSDWSAAVRRSPVSDSLHFDLACTGRGRVVWQDDPTRPIVRPNPQQWEDSPHFVVDLEAMRFCDRYECATRGLRPIESVSDRRIIFTDIPGLSETFDRGEGRFAMAALNLGRFQVTEGSCTVEPFSGFPPLE